jgi:hypothetical protein
MVRHDLAPDLQDFLSGVVREQEREWVDLKDELWDPATPRGAFEQRVWMNYDLLQAWDVLSLLCCLAPTARAAERATLGSVPTRLVGERTAVQVASDRDSVLRLSPWPFTPAEVVVEVPGVLIPDRDYRSRDDAAGQLSESEPLTFTVRLVAATSHM